MKTYRVYNGCPEPALQKIFDEQAELLAKLRQTHPEAHVTYFPMEQKYHVHVWGKSLSDFHDDQTDALIDALSRV